MVNGRIISESPRFFGACVCNGYQALSPRRAWVRGYSTCRSRMTAEPGNDVFLDQEISPKAVLIAVLIKKKVNTGTLKKRRLQKQGGRKPRRNRKQKSKEYYGVCHEPYLEFTETEEKWIGCELCDTWYHIIYLGITVGPAEFLCENCR